jgi:hypothetical protein
MRLAGSEFLLALYRQLYLSRKYNPDQPRVPGGQPGGGQWTSGSGGGGFGGGGGTSTVGDVADGGDGLGLDGGFDAGLGALDGLSLGDLPGTLLDTTGLASWERIDTLRDGNGDLLGQAIYNRDGSSIFSRYAPVGDPGWTSSHVVELPDGARFAFDTAGDTQTISTLDGTVLSRSTWGPTGPEPEPVIQPVFVPPTPTVIGALAIFGSQSLLNDDKGSAVLAYRAYDFQADADGKLPILWTGRVDRSDVEAACPRYGEVQDRTDAAMAKVDREQNYYTATQRGTAIHEALKEDIRSLKDDNFKSEISVLKSEEAGGKGSVRVDVLERVGNGTVCVYDIKTGEKPLSLPRSVEIATNVNQLFPNTWRILLIEVRPRK